MQELIKEIKQNFDIFYFLDNLADYVQIMDKDLNIIWLNDAAKKFAESFGYTKNKSKNLFDWLPFLNSRKNDIIEEYNSVINTGEKVITEENFLINNKTIYTKTIKMPLIKNGEVKYIATIVYNQTDLKNSISNIEAERNRLLGIFDSINEIIYVTDPNTYQIIYVNKYFMDILEKNMGLTTEEIKTHKCYEVFQKLDSPCDFCTNKIICQKPGEPYRWQYYNPSLDMYFLITDKLITWANGNLVRFEIAINITDEIDVQIKLEDTIKKLEQSNKMLEDFAHIISHDLREPLRTVVNFLSILQEPENDVLDENKEWISKAHENSIKMQKMINELLLLSKLNHNIDIDKSKIDVKLIINDIIKDLELKLEETSAIIEIDDNIDDIFGEYLLIKQVFSNLICNAISAVPDGRTPIIKISSIQENGVNTYIVQDNGVGMKKEKIHQIFHENAIWDSPLTLKGGMGIPICRRIAYLHHGVIDAKSDDNGTFIYFTISNREE